MAPSFRSIKGIQNTFDNKEAPAIKKLIKPLVAPSAIKKLIKPEVAPSSLEKLIKPVLAPSFFEA